MPYGVRAWPSADDLRTATFCASGWRWDAVPPYLWRLSTSGALAPFDVLNSGIVLGVVSHSFGHYLAHGALVWPGWPDFVLNILGFEHPQGASPPYTIRFIFEATAPGVDFHSGDRFELYPFAIDQFSLAIGSSGTLLIPNPLLAEPTIWDTPLSPHF